MTRCLLKDLASLPNPAKRLRRIVSLDWSRSSEEVITKAQELGRRVVRNSMRNKGHEMLFNSEYSVTDVWDKLNHRARQCYLGTNSQD